MAAIAYLEINQGSDFTTEFTLENDDESPMVLRDCEAYSQFRKSYGSVTGYSFTTSVVNAENKIIALAFVQTHGLAVSHPILDRPLAFMIG